MRTSITARLIRAPRRIRRRRRLRIADRRRAERPPPERLTSSPRARNPSLPGEEPLRPWPGGSGARPRWSRPATTNERNNRRCSCGCMHWSRLLRSGITAPALTPRVAAHIAGSERHPRAIVTHSDPRCRGITDNAVAGADSGGNSSAELRRPYGPYHRFLVPGRGGNPLRTRSNRAPYEEFWIITNKCYVLCPWVVLRE